MDIHEKMFRAMVKEEQDGRDMLVNIEDVDGDMFSVEALPRDTEQFERYGTIAQISCIDPVNCTGGQLCITREQLVEIRDAMTALLLRG